ncbi:MAG TPA: ferritin-like domain-containing protein [Blastocatellia bacterium]|nr:ferritin-like domain-containing protein [Blastocatellia bacterium]
MPIAWHAPYELIRPETRDMARAIHSLMEELEAMDWYSQRVDVTDDESLKRILAHHADEEKEHAVMLIEWIRRRDPEWDKYLRTYLFTTADITEVEESAESPATSDPGPASPRSAAPVAGRPVAGGPIVAAPTASAGVEANTLTVGSLRQRK